MLLNEYIEKFSLYDYPVFSKDDQACRALRLLAMQGRSCAPVLDDGKPVGLVTLAALLANDGAGEAGSLPLSSFPLDPITTAGPHEHLLDVFNNGAGTHGDILAVVDHAGDFHAVVEKSLLAVEVASLFHLRAGECVTIELDVPASGVKLSEIVAVFEKNDAYVTAFGTRQSPVDNDSIIVCFRVRTHDHYRLITNLDKYGYRVRYVSPEAGSADDELREKALEFIRFMDM
ncbi:MAG: CBS domain-containing protein [Chlorobium sp.]|uniref:CBS domain-containing protein n=1 Tax=Chlorobium sp. TaxID=1095 RepID=UPI0025B7EF96|nr:CBS domain-containing protein [Chlorobium sp.]MCF8217232.1 CBS domain-containing protein [Chlorobium sp.]MCF8272090.1 CBS domain-containing protein [Chlorobium sp.]MCF8288451.1 CBS domain-containing protein [Chlorobium sp.]MCF8292041.1 CBS domain-containing protein [Chlorobium sp.]MCF8386143.1 CBS domain-containing protein [Chlorobium sp.]